MGSWGEQYVDQQVDRAWLDLRMDLADRFEAALTECDADSVDFTTPEGQTLTINVAEEQVVILAGDSVVVTDNVDEAAFRVYEILHEEWQVLHPVFLDSPVVEVPAADDNARGVLAPVLGRADSRETLQAWAVATFQETCDQPLKVGSNGDIGWFGQGGTAATVSVRDQNWIEVWSVLATEVSFKKARKVVEGLSRRYTGVNFSFRRDMLVMSRMVDAGPFVPDHLTDALSMHLDLAVKLAWVREAVLRKRVKQQRAQAVPSELLGLLPSANRVSAAVLADRVAVAACSTATLNAWLELCRREWRKARLLPRGAEDPQRLNHRLRMGWKRLGRAVELALQARRQVGEVA